MSQLAPSRPVKLSKLGQREWCPWPHLDPETWPGRELVFMWCHPVLAILLLASAIGTLVLLVTNPGF